MNEIPSGFPLQIAEKILIAGRKLGLVMGIIQMEMEFDGPLDAQRLSRALDLLLIQPPILGCKMVSQSGKSFWQRLDKTEPMLFLARDREEYAKFRISFRDPCTGPQISACLWQRPEGDCLVLKVIHAVSDAGGVKEIGMDLAKIYSRLEKDADYQPLPNLKGSRRAGQVLRYLPSYKYPGLFLDFLLELWSNFFPRESLTLPLAIDPKSPMTYVIRHLGADQVSRLAEYGRSRDATLNDLIIAAFYRALAKQGNWDRASQLRLQITVDLRRYLPEARAEEICNLSAKAYPYLGANLGGDFEETLKRVASITRKLKQNWIGMPMFVSSLAILSLISEKVLMKLLGSAMMQGVKEGKEQFPPFLTNMGLIGKESMAFGAQIARKAWLLPPLCYPPVFFSGLSGYSGSLTLSSGLPQSSQSIVEAFLAK